MHALRNRSGKQLIDVDAQVAGLHCAWKKSVGQHQKFACALLDGGKLLAADELPTSIQTLHNLMQLYIELNGPA